MGVVFKAQDTKLNRIVALKFLPDRVTGDAVTRSRFLQEAQAAAVLNHPNICVIHDVREDDGRQYMVMEYVEGRTLRDANGRSGMAMETAVEYALQIAEALEEAHSKGIVHRNIKADNIMINAKDQVKVMDFGLAKLKGSLKLTRTSSTVGTLAYMAPEQIQGGEVDPRSDIFSFGVLFFEMLTGRLPFRGEHEAAMMYSILNEDPESVQKSLPDAPAELSFLLKTALEKNPVDRYQRMSDVVRDLRRLKKQSSRVNRPAYSGEYQRVKDERTATATSALPAPRRRYALVGGIVAGTIAVAAAVVLFLLPSGGTAFSSFQFSRITSTGNVQGAAISPDNRYICYSQFDKGKYSLWVRQLATSANIQIRPPQSGFIGDPIFSRDGNFVYFRMLDERSNEPALYRIPVLGGASVKVLSNVQGSVTFSPDGSKIAFNRVYQGTGYFALVVASADGSNQKDLAAYKGEKWITGTPSWLPKGDVIVVPLGLWEGGFHHELVSVDVGTGEVRPFSKKRWDLVRRAAWLSDGSGLIVEGGDLKTTQVQLFYIAYPSGTARRITNDMNDYGGSSVTDDRRKICTVQGERELYLYHVPNGESRRAVKITTLKDDGFFGITVGRDNTLYYVSRQGGSYDIWAVGLDGRNQRQVTNDAHAEQMVSVSPAGDLIAFSSARSGLPSIWTVRPDGSEVKQVTDGAEDYGPSVDPSGTWIVFHSWLRGPNTVMKVPVGGGERIDLTRENGTGPVLSNDGRTVYYSTFADGKGTVFAVPIDGGASKRLFEIPKNISTSLGVRPGTNELSYVLTTDGVSNVYTRPVSGGPERRFTDFKEHLIASYAWTPDGRSLVVCRGELRSDVVILTDEEE